MHIVIALHLFAVFSMFLRESQSILFLRNNSVLINIKVMNIHVNQ